MTRACIGPHLRRGACSSSRRRTYISDRYELGAIDAAIARAGQADAAKVMVTMG